MDLADAGTTDLARSRALLAGQNQALQLAVGGAPLASVLDVLVLTAERQSDGGVLASILLLEEEGERLRHGAAPSLPAAYSQAIDGLVIGPSVGSCGTAAWRNQVVVVSDIASDPLWTAFRSLAHEHGLAACWSTPIRSTLGEVLGTFAMYYREPRAPSGHDRQVVELLANTAAVVIERDREARERSRIEQSLRSRQERFRALVAASQAIHASLSVEEVVAVITERARTIVGARDATVTLFASGSPASLQVPECEGLSVSLNGAQGAKLGIVQLTGKLSGEFSTDDEAVLTQLASMASVSIENARLYESLREANQRKDEFLATLAHELRNPLAPIGNAIALLRKGGAQATEKVIGIMERQLRQMVHLVDDLLDVSRVTTGKIVLKREPAEVREIVQVAIEASLPLMQAARHTLHLDLPPEALHVVGDRTRLAQVLTNLLNNAAKYTPDGGRITLTARATRRDVLLQVRDSGLGIPADMLPRVFEIFTQVKHAEERSQGGLGLGLALVKKLVEMHGGDVWAESPGLVQGSTFTVRLPLAHAEVQPQEGAATAPVAAAAAFRILVVDDNHDAAESLAMLLQLSNHETMTAYSGPQAIDVARRTRPRAVFLDIGLPGMNGYEVAKAMREDPDLSGTTLVALTGWGTETDQKQALQAGFDYHLTKPAAPDQVQELLARMGQGPVRDGLSS
ncbi:response regulator [Ramlibacter sp. USB13]|uniref:histidine kinase n=1 Tax=Ramlibacter cellulosilyticus TaxID=2764187 RepID=A0A923MSK5_9BURK|nr:ATP-binding protein [Ramlibacter cellulosilyticus]MBC5784410.1 response regulator [Ramlibacter cellulosilyticus]